MGRVKEQAQQPAPEQQTEATGNAENGATADLVAETLSGDVRDFLVDRIRQLPKVWAEMTQEEQHEIINAAIMAGNSLVRKAVRLIAQDGRPTIVARCEQVTVKDGIKAVVTLPQSDPLRHALVDSQGSDVLVIVVDAENYIGSRGDLKPDAPPTEPELPMSDDGPIFDRTAAAAA